MNDYPLVEVTARTTINGKDYGSAVSINLSHVSEEMIRHSLLGEIGRPFEVLLLSLLRTARLGKTDDK